VKSIDIKNHTLSKSMKNTILEARQINSKGIYKGFRLKIKDSRTSTILRNKKEKKSMIVFKFRSDKQIYNFKSKSS